MPRHSFISSAACSAVRGAAVALALAGACLSASAQYTKVIAFGDSLSDNGNYSKVAYSLTGIVSPSPPNAPGRFCNGLMAVEVMANELNLPLDNRAFAAATTGVTALLPLVVPVGMMSQVTNYLAERTAKLKGAEPTALYFLWGGPDDFYGIVGPDLGPLVLPTAVNNIKTEIATLYNAGARNFMVPLMPDMSTTPSAIERDLKNPGYAAKYRKISDDFDAGLTKAIAELRAKYPKINIITFDTLGYLRQQIPLAAARGINTTEACRPGGLTGDKFFTPQTQVCDNPDNYLFWDDNHPTAVANAQLGQEWAKAVRGY